MNRLDLFKTAIFQVNELGSHYPSDAAFNSVRVQLEYLVELETGKRKDRERLNEIIIGVLASREIEPLNAAVADVLYEVVGEVEQMKMAK